MTDSSPTPSNRSITVADHEFRVDGEKVTFYGGAVHYCDWTAPSVLEPAPSVLAEALA